MPVTPWLGSACSTDTGRVGVDHEVLIGAQDLVLALLEVELLVRAAAAWCAIVVRPSATAITRIHSGSLITAMLSGSSANAAAASAFVRGGMRATM